MSAKPYSPWDEVLPAMQTSASAPSYCTKVMGRQRTPYFYLKMAMVFARDARSYRGTFYEISFPGIYGTYKRLALHYFATYKAMKNGRAV